MNSKKKKQSMSSRGNEKTKDKQYKANMYLKEKKYNSNSYKKDKKYEEKQYEQNKKYDTKTYKKDVKKETNKGSTRINNNVIKDKENNDRIFEDQVEGRNSVLELLESNKDINKIFIAKGERHGSINKIIAKAKEQKVVVVEKDRKQLEEIAQTENCQGVIAIVPPYEYCEVEDILQKAKEQEEEPFIIILDGIEDPHNLGSIIRTAETAGVHGVIIPKRRAATVNSTVNKASAGAVEHMRIARVTNISDTIEELKRAGLWICGTDIETNKYYYNQDLKGPIGIVIGNEGKGISEKVKKNCDFIVKIPMKGRIESLNAAVSTGIVVYEVVKQRKLEVK